MNRDRSVVGMLIASALLGVLAGVGLVGQILWASDGLRPAGVCDIHAGDVGWLPLNPNRGGDIPYSCTPDLPLFAFYAAFPAALIAALAFAISYWARRNH